VTLVFGDNLRRQKIPFATYGIATVCVLVAAFPTRDIALGFVPLTFSLNPAASLYTLLTAQFVHLNLLHLGGNLLFFMALGRSLENVLGSIVFAAALLGLGPLAFLGSWLITPNSPVPIVGFSGSLSLLLGAYTVVFPRARLWIIPFVRFVSMRAWVFASIWLALQVFDAVSAGEAGTGVALFTHIAGFIIGLVAGAAWKELALDTDRIIAQVTGE
jgi:membrane associated rhomboid family serine protease